jgi:hypothetical protein
LPSKLTSASAAIPAFRPCLPSRCLAMDYSITIYFDSQLKQLFPFLVFHSTFVIMYPNDQSYMPNVKTYLLNACVVNVNSGNQDSPMTFFFMSGLRAWKLHSGHARKNWRVTNFIRQMCFSDKATFHVSGVENRYNCRMLGSQNPHVTWLGERQPKSEPVVRLNARQNWTFFFFGKDSDRTFILRHAGAVCAAPITTSNLSNKMGRRHISASMLGITWT